MCKAIPSASSKTIENKMPCNGKLGGRPILSFIALLFIVLAVPTTGKEHWNVHSFLEVDNVVALLGEEGRKWADVYLPTAVSPTSPCGRALQAMFADLTNSSNLWALSMVDAWGKANDGIAFGNTLFIGRYDQCLSITSPDDKLKGKYCRVNTYDITKQQLEEQSLDIPRPENIRLPVIPWMSHLPHNVNKEPRTIFGSLEVGETQYWTCMPNVCTEADLSMSVTKQNLIGHKTVAVASCTDEETKPQFTDADVGFMALITFLLVLIVCSSLVDIYLPYTGNKTLRKGVLKYLLVFSAYTNLTKMLQINPNPSPGTITCLQGMRVLSMTWVLYCHQQSATLFFSVNLFDIGKWTEGIMAQAISNGFPSVDTFFFFSGLLVTYSVLRGLEKGRFNIGLFFFHRLIRLIPPIGIVAGFMATVLRFFVFGPFAYTWDNYWQPNCVKNWWKDIAFVNNFMYENDCLGQVWYVAVDTQLYIIAPIVILPLFFCEAAGKAWLFIITVASAVIPAAIIYAFDYPPTNLIYGPEGSSEYFLNVYLVPWCRAGPWVAGIWLGYIFYKQNSKRVKISPLMVTVGWTMAAVTALLVVFGLVSYNVVIDPFPFEMMTQVVYGGGHRLAWGAVLAWLVFACHNGYGGIVDDFLSHPVWQPISRLTYALYLVAFPMQFLLAYNLHTTPYYSYINKIIETVGSLVLAFPGAVLVSLMAESPVMGLEKLLLTPSPRHSNKHEATSKPDKATNHSIVEVTGGVHNPTFTAENSTDGGKEHLTEGNIMEHAQKKNQGTSVTSL